MHNLTKPQKLIYDMEKFAGGSIATVCGSIIYKGKKDVESLQKIVNDIVKLNDALRIRIIETENGIEQYITEFEYKNYPVLTFETKDDLTEYAAKLANEPMDFYGSLCHISIIISQDFYGILLKLHHIISDAWTFSLIGNQLNALLNGENVDAYSYFDYAISENEYILSKRYQKDKAYFIDNFKKCDEVTYLSDKQVKSLEAERKTFVLDKDKTAKILEYAANQNTSVFMVLMTALAVYINRVKMNKEKFYIGTAVLNRSNMQEKNTMGMFINTIPMLIELDNDKTFEENLENISNEGYAVLRHQKYNYGDILKDLRQEFNFTEKLYDVIFSYQNASVIGNDFETAWYNPGMQTESLQIHVDDRDNEGILKIHYDYQIENFTENEIERIHNHIYNLLFDAIGYELQEMEIKKDENLEGTITIGKPIANTQIYIVDKFMHLVPVGVTGELCIAGDGVGAGYLNRPELTAEKFIDNPFGEGKLYKTGDLAYFREDGNIAYVGRNDFQVKIRGLRIELGEIENAISPFKGINQAVVVADKDDNGHQYIAAYYVSENEINESSLKKTIGAKLPKYMLPHYFVKLDKMPMTASGKVSRRDLPKPDFSLMQTNEYVAPKNEQEEKLCTLFGEVLNVEKVGREDDFFDLGGDSLLAITLITKIEKAFSKHISTKDIMENSTVLTLSKLLGDVTNNSEKIPVINTKRYKITPQQMGVYSACASTPDSLIYNMPTKVIFPQNVNIEKIKDAIIKVFDNHTTLHTHFENTDEGVYGIIDEASKLEIEENKTEKEFVRAFDLEKAPLFRVCINGNTMLFDTHHIISDGTTIHNMLKEMTSVYNGNKSDGSELSYGDYATYLECKINSDRFKEAEDFYKAMLEFEFEPMELPQKQYDAVKNGNQISTTISKTLFDNCKRYAKEHNITDTAFFMSVYGILLNRYCLNDNILTSITLTNREHSQVQNTNGMFVNTVPIMFNVDENKSFVFLADKVNSLLLDIYKYGELPFLTIADKLKINNKKAMNTSFVYQAQGEIAFEFENNKIVPEFIATNTSKFELTWEIIPSSAGANIRVEYNCNLLDDSMAERMMDSFVLLLEQIAK